jgi:hypothetical protein
MNPTYNVYSVAVHSVYIIQIHKCNIRRNYVWCIEITLRGETGVKYHARECLTARIHKSVNELARCNKNTYECHDTGDHVTLKFFDQQY